MKVRTPRVLYRRMDCHEVRNTLRSDPTRVDARNYVANLDRFRVPELRKWTSVRGSARWTTVKN